MPERAVWLGSREFADLIGVPVRTARYALCLAAEAKLWRGYTLEVREVHGRGGRSGLSYEVSLRSLSEALGDPLIPYAPVRPTPARRPRDIARDQGAVRRQREAAILPFVDLEPRSAERAAALQLQAECTGVPVRTLNRWAAMYLSHGANGLARKRPSNAGRQRILVSRIFDAAFRAAGYQDELLETIAHDATQAIKGLWKSRREASGYNAVRRDAETLLELACEGYGVQLPPAVFRLSRRRVEAFAGYRVVNVYRNDRKRWDDSKPRIRRDWTGLDPMAVVVADVKPLDVIVTRPDGSTAWPRVIGFLDAATFRLFLSVVLLAPGEGVRQEHVHEAFLAMVAEPGWGFPRALYLDNGSEFGALDKLKDAMELLAEPDARTLIRAKPYNASAKPIESAFARLDKLFTCILPGYAGRDRMTKKTQTVGRPPQPYPHGWERFVADVQLGVADLNHTPLTGPIWQGRAPAQMAEAAVAAGWRPVTVDPLALDAAFHNTAHRKVGKGGSLRIDGRVYPVPGVPAGAMVSVALPWRRGADPLYQPPGSTAWSYLSEDLALPAAWTDGAKETARRQRLAVKAVRQLERDAPEIDPLEVMRARARRRVGAPLPRPSPALDVGSMLTGVAAAISTGAGEKAAILTEAERVQRERAARIARDQRRYGNG